MDSSKAGNSKTTNSQPGFTPGLRTMQYRGDLGEYHSLAEGGNVVGRFDSRDDALLDASAPDLYAALERLLYFRDTDDTPNSDPWQAARLALARARGGVA